MDWAGVQRHLHGAIATIAPTDSEARYTGLGATVLRANARGSCGVCLIVAAADSAAASPRRDNSSTVCRVVSSETDSDVRCR